MIPVQTLETFDIFGDPSSQVSPAPAKYAQGYLPGEVLPAQHENFFLGKSSRCVTQLRDGVASIENELVNVVTAGGATPDASTNNQVLAAINYLIAAAEARAKLAAHPVHSLFWTSEPPTITVEGVEQPNPAGDPQLLFGGGTWVRLKGAFIWAAGDNDTVLSNTTTPGVNDGRTSVTASDLPGHKHGATGLSAKTSDTRNAGNTANKTLTGYFEISKSALLYPRTNGICSSSSAGSDTGYVGGSAPYYSCSIDATHSHNVTITGSTASNNANVTDMSIKNPFINRYCWQRTA